MCVRVCACVFTAGGLTDAQKAKQKANQAALQLMLSKGGVMVSALAAYDT